MEALTELLLDRRINLAEPDFALELGCCLVPLRLEGLAMAAPGGIKLN